MSENKVNEDQSAASDEKWLGQLKNILFAGIGVAAMAQEEVEVLVKTLVQKGAIAEQEGRKWIKEVFDKGYKQTKAFENNLETNVEDLVKRFSLPTKAQFEKLSGEVEQLRKKVEELCEKLQ